MSPPGRHDPSTGANPAQPIHDRNGPQACLVPPDLEGPVRDLTQRTVNEYLAESYSWTLPVTRHADGPGLHILIGNSSNNRVIADLTRQGSLQEERSDIGKEGFHIFSKEIGDRRFLIITANTPCGLKHACQELVFFRMSVTAEEAHLDWPLDVSMKPEFPYRGVYMLPCWAAHDSVDSWKRVLRFHSELTLNRNWFWLAGFPLLNGYGGDYRDTDLAQPDNVRQLIDLCHQEGMKFYVGGGWFTWHHERHAAGSIDRGIQYYLDLIDLFPEVDGIFLEPTGEGSSVDENVWSRHVDALRRLIETTSEKRPEFEFAIAIGKFNHERYRRAVHDIDDERVYWWWCWGDPLREKALDEHPLVLRWHIISPMCDYHGSTQPPQPSEKNLTGFATSYDPGQGFGNPWNGWGKLGVDHPRNFHPRSLPFFSHQYLFRERCWNPELTDDEFALRLSRRLFDADMPRDSIEHYLALAALCPTPQAADSETLRHAEEFVRKFSGKGTPRNRDTLRRMHEALDGINSIRNTG